MKVLRICYSPRQKGNTESLVVKALRGARQKGIVMELFSVSSKLIESCDGLRNCGRILASHIKNDILDLCRKMIETDATIFATLTHNCTMIAQRK